MQRYELKPDGWTTSHSLLLSWDRPWRAYVALVRDASIPPGQDKIILRIGCKPPHDRYPDLDALLSALNAAIAGKFPPVALPEATRQALLKERAWHFADLRRRGIDPEEPLDFSEDDDEDDEPLGPSMAYPPFYLLRTAAYCPKCRTAMHVYMLGCAAYRDAEDGGEEPIEDFHFLRLVESVPDDVLSLLKSKCPSFRFAREKRGGSRYLMNHCRCGAKLDDDYLHGDVGAAFWPDTPDGYGDLELFTLPVDEPIPVKSSYMLGGGEYLDYDHAKPFADMDGKARKGKGSE